MSVSREQSNPRVSSKLPSVERFAPRPSAGVRRRGVPSDRARRPTLRKGRTLTKSVIVYCAHQGVGTKTRSQLVANLSSFASEHPDHPSTPIFRDVAEWIPGHDLPQGSVYFFGILDDNRSAFLTAVNFSDDKPDITMLFSDRSNIDDVGGRWGRS